MEICDLGCVCQSLVCIALLQVHACKLDWIMRSPLADSGASWCRVAVLLLTLCLMNESGSAIPFEEFVGYPLMRVTATPLSLVNSIWCEAFSSRCRFPTLAGLFHMFM